MRIMMICCLLFCVGCINPHKRRRVDTRFEVGTEVKVSDVDHRYESGKGSMSISMKYVIERTR